MKDAPTFARLRERGKTIPGKGAIYQVRYFNYGLIVPGEGRMGTVGMEYDAGPAAMPAAFSIPAAIRPYSIAVAPD